MTGGGKLAISDCDLLAHAEANAGGAQSEVNLRASVSRAYYSAFHALLPLVEILPPSKKAKGSEVTHVELTERMVEWKVDASCPALGEYRDIKARAQRAMDTARGKRIVSDYRLGAAVTKAEALGQIQRVILIRRAAATLLGVVNDHAGDRNRKTGTQ